MGREWKSDCTELRKLDREGGKMGVGWPRCFDCERRERSEHQEGKQGQVKAFSKSEHTPGIFQS